MIFGTAKTTNTDFTKTLLEGTKKVVNSQVYVGVSEEKAARRSEGINNAALVFIHTNGSPLRKIPARPIIEPAIEAEDNKKHITEELGLAARAMLEGKVSEAHKYLDLAGQAAETAARDWFDDGRNGWPQDSDLTIERKTKKHSKESEGFEAISQTLIDTGQMKKSITHIVVPA